MCDDSERNPSEVRGEPEEYEIEGDEGTRIRWHFGKSPDGDMKGAYRLELGKIHRTNNVRGIVPSPLASNDRSGFGVAGGASDATDCSESVRSMTSREKRGDFLRGGSRSRSSIGVILSAGGGSAFKSGR